MKISIVTVCYNAEATIERALLSVLMQEQVDLQYIVIDGVSSDSTFDIVRRHGQKIDTYLSEPDKGLYDAMNKGIQRAKGDVVGFLNADDSYAHLQVLKKVAHVFEDQEIDALYGDITYLNKGNVVRNWVSGDYHRSKFERGWMPPHPSFFVRRKYFESFGSFNTDFKISADYELMLRMLYVHKLRTYYLRGNMVNMEVGGVSNKSLTNRLISRVEDAKAWKVNKLSTPWFWIMAKPLLKLSQYL